MVKKVFFLLVLLSAEMSFADFKLPANRNFTVGNSAGNSRLKCANKLPESLEIWMGPQTHNLWQIDFAYQDGQSSNMMLTLSKNGAPICKFNVAYDTHLNWHGAMTDPILRVDDKMELTQNPVCVMTIGKEFDLRGIVGQSLKINMDDLRFCAEAKKEALDFAVSPFKFYKITDPMHCKYGNFSCAPVYGESNEP